MKRKMRGNPEKGLEMYRVRVMFPPVCRMRIGEKAMITLERRQRPDYEKP